MNDQEIVLYDPDNVRTHTPYFDMFKACLSPSRQVMFVLKTGGAATFERKFKVIIQQAERFSGPEDRHTRHENVKKLRDTKFNAGQNNITQAYQRVALMLFALLNGDDLQISRLFAHVAFHDDNMALKLTKLAYRKGRDVPHHVWLMAAVADDIRRGNLPRSFDNWQVEIDKRSPRASERMEVLKFCENCGRMHSIKMCFSTSMNATSCKRCGKMHHQSVCMSTYIEIINPM